VNGKGAGIGLAGEFAVVSCGELRRAAGRIEVSPATSAGEIGEMRHHVFPPSGGNRSRWTRCRAHRDVDSFSRWSVVNGMGGGTGLAVEFAAKTVSGEMLTTTPRAGEPVVNGRVGV
jgi:hypothetical protein